MNLKKRKYDNKKFKGRSKQETCFDVWLLVSTNEFVIDTWQQNVFVWGYPAARKR